jgi:thiol-disulfide isomerase/thioredoxin
MRNKVVLFILACLISGSAMTQGIEFFHGTWEEALLKAKEEDKIIFVDAFTTWCGPCKNMAANTFPDPEVGKLFNQNFISMKIDMEKEMGLEFRKKFDVTAYPTLFFIDYDGTEIMKSVGGRSPADLIKTAESVLVKFDKSSKYAAAYAAGDHSYKLVYDYVVALNKSKKPSNKIVNDYLAEQTDLTTPDNLKFILEAASQVDCKCFELLEKYKTQIVKLTSDEAFKAKIRSACANTVQRAVEYESPELITLAADAMKRNIPGEAELFLSQSNISYALALHDLGHIEEMVNNHVKKFIKNDPEGLHQLALDLNKYGSDQKICLDLAISLAAKAAKEDNAQYISTYAQLINKSGDRQEAIHILEEAIRKYSNEDQNNKDLQALIALKAKIENG